MAKKPFCKLITLGETCQSRTIPNPNFDLQSEDFKINSLLNEILKKKSNDKNIKPNLSKHLLKKIRKHPKKHTLKFPIIIQKSSNNNVSCKENLFFEDKEMNFSKIKENSSFSDMLKNENEEYLKNNCHRLNEDCLGGDSESENGNEFEEEEEIYGLGENKRFFEENIADYHHDDL